jgi:hypothetical protein
VLLTLPDATQVLFQGNSAIQSGKVNFGDVGTSTGTGCSAICGGDFAGTFAGPKAQYAGFTYNAGTTAFGDVRGAVVLRK